MKKWWWMVLSLLYIQVSGQEGQCNILLTKDKTSSLIFPAAIVKVDLGTRNILVQPVAEAKNILLVKAASSRFAETNLSVVTADGAFYSFTVGYDSLPGKLVYNIPFSAHANAAGLVSDYARVLLNSKRVLHRVHDNNYGISFLLEGIYVKDEVLYCQLDLRNESSLDYTVDFLHFSIRDKKKVKRTAMQELELKPLFIAGNARLIKANSNNKIVIALEKFTIPDGKNFLIQVNEQNGGRHLRLRVCNNKIIKARILPCLQ